MRDPSPRRNGTTTCSVVVEINEKAGKEPVTMTIRPDIDRSPLNIVLVAAEGKLLHRSAGRAEGNTGFL
jgi:hypothetical protein